MSGVKTNLKNMGNAFEKIKADIKREETINKYWAEYMHEGHPPSVAMNKAEARYKDESEKKQQQQQ